MVETGRQTVLRTFNRVGYNTFESFKGGKSKSFVKVSGSDGSGHGDPVAQFESYQQLRKYLHMPRVRLLSSEKSQSPRLVIQRVKGERLDKVLIENPELFHSPAERFSTDLNRMWEATQIPFREDQLVVDLRKATIDTLQAVLQDESIARRADLPINVNGTTYKSLREICSTAFDILETKTDPVMVLGHGDEHMKNLFVMGTNPPDYEIIDPRLAGYYSPARAVNAFIGYPLLFFFGYESAQDVGNSWNLTYQIDGRFKKSMEELKVCVRTMVNNLRSLNNNGFLIKEYLLGNLLRTVIGRVNPKDKSLITKSNTLANIGMAVEMYSNFDKFLEPSQEKLEDTRLPSPGGEATGGQVKKPLLGLQVLGSK